MSTWCSSKLGPGSFLTVRSFHRDRTLFLETSEVLQEDGWENLSLVSGHQAPGGKHSATQIKLLLWAKDPRESQFP